VILMLMLSDIDTNAEWVMLMLSDIDIYTDAE
jgi:hypothetical protein